MKSVCIDSINSPLQKCPLLPLSRPRADILFYPHLPVFDLLSTYDLWFFLYLCTAHTTLPLQPSHILHYTTTLVVVVYSIATQILVFFLSSTYNSIIIIHLDPPEWVDLRRPNVVNLPSPRRRLGASKLSARQGLPTVSRSLQFPP